MLHEGLSKKKIISDNFMDRIVDFCISVFVLLVKKRHCVGQSYFSGLLQNV